MFNKYCKLSSVWYQYIRFYPTYPSGKCFHDLKKTAALEIWVLWNILNNKMNTSLDVQNEGSQKYVSLYHVHDIFLWFKASVVNPAVKLCLDIQYSRYEHAGAATEEDGCYSNNMVLDQPAWLLLRQHGRLSPTWKLQTSCCSDQMAGCCSHWIGAI